MNDDQQPKPEESQETNDQWSETPTDEQSQASEGSSLDNTESQDSSLSSDEAPQSDGVSDEPQSPEPVPQPPTPEAQPVAPVPPVAPPQSPMYPPQPAPAMAGYGVAQPIVPTGVPTENPGQGFGIAGIVLGVLAIWPAGLPLSIVSMVKSSKVNASKTLGIVGLIINILAILGSGLFLLIAIIGFAALQDSADDLSSSSSISSSSTISLDENYSPTGGDVYFNVPTSMTGWTMTKIDEEGVNEFTKDDSTQRFMTYQGVQSELTGQDREITASAMTLYVSEMSATTVPSSDGTINVTLQSGGSLEFMTRRITMTSEGTELMGIVAIRIYEGHELSLIYLATTDAFSSVEWVDFVSQVSIADGAL